MASRLRQHNLDLRLGGPNTRGHKLPNIHPETLARRANLLRHRRSIRILHHGVEPRISESRSTGADPSYFGFLCVYAGVFVPCACEGAC